MILPMYRLEKKHWCRGVQMSVVNTGPEAMCYTNALHTYFRVGDIHQVTVTGLEDCPYHDNLEKRVLRDAEGSSITFRQETDRIYTKTGALV